DILPFDLQLLLLLLLNLQLRTRRKMHELVHDLGELWPAVGATVFKDLHRLAIQPISQFPDGLDIASRGLVEQRACNLAQAWAVVAGFLKLRYERGLECFALRAAARIARLSGAPGRPQVFDVSSGVLTGHISPRR